MHIQRSYLLCTSLFFGSRKDSGSDHYLGLFISNISYIHKKSSLLCDRTKIITGCKNFSVTHRIGGKNSNQTESFTKENLTQHCFVVYTVCYLLFLVGCKNNQRKYRSLANDIILFVTLYPVKSTQPT